MFNNSWFKKEKPLPGFMGFGGGATSISLAGGDAPGIDASGGFVSDNAAPDGTLYRYHIWRSSGSFVVADLGSSDGSVEYFALGGGGKGGGPRGGGGGAGGLVSNMPGISGALPPATPTAGMTVAAGTIPVSFGWGGIDWGADYVGPNQYRGMDTVITFPTGAITAYGGGQGGGNAGPQSNNQTRWTGSPGGCGGGGGNDGTGSTNPQSPTSDQAASTSPSGQGYGAAPIGASGPNCDTYEFAGTGGGGLGGAPPGSGNARKNYGQACPGPPTNPGSWPGGAVSPTNTNLCLMGSPGGAGVVITSLDFDDNQFGVPGPSPGRWFGGGGGGGCNDGYNPPNSSPLPAGEPPTHPTNPTSQRTGGAGGGGQGSSGGQQGTKGSRNWEFFPNGNPNSTGYHPGGQDGIQNTGAGGGGGGYNYGGSRGGTGGDGTAIIRYTISAKQSGTAKASGGLIAYTPTHVIHTFLSPGTFTSDAGFSETVEYVCLAGGGQGGGAGSDKKVGGGGGAGGYRTGTTPFTTPTATGMAVVVGSGGKGTDDSEKWFMGPEDYPQATEQLKTGPEPGRPSSVVFPTGTIMSDGGGAGGAPKSGETRDPLFASGTAFPQIDGPTASKYWWSWWGSPGGSGGGQSGSRVNSPDYQNYGLGNCRVDFSPDVNPGQGNPGGGNPPTGLSDEVLCMAGGGGGAGGAGGFIPPGPSTPTGRTTAQKKSGAGGIGVQLPTTFRNPQQLFAPGPGGNWYVGGGGEGGWLDNTGGAGPENQDATAPGGVAPGGGGVGNQNYSPPTNPYGPTNPSLPGQVGGPQAISEASRGVNGCGSGGGGGCSGGPSAYNADGGFGGDGVIMIAYPS